jgi:hypothetical protein
MPKSMKKKLLPLLLFTTILLYKTTVSQMYIEPIVGFQNDVNNHFHFSQINTAVQFSYKFKRNYELSFQLQRSWPLSYHTADSSFTLTPSLPLYAPAQKTIKASNQSIAIINRFNVLGRKPKSTLNILAGVGVTRQDILVNYQYDKNNYTILNPDETQKPSGLFLSGGLEYLRDLKYGRIFAQIIIATQPSSKKINYPSSFVYMAPLCLNAGYSFSIKTKKK